MYPHTITIINRVQKGRGVKWYTHTIEGVHFQDKQGVRTGSTDHFTDNQGYVQIPRTIEGYLSPEEYKQLSDKENHWTIKEDDYIVKGTTVNIDSPQETLGARVIQSYEDIDYGITLPGHYGVYLK